MSTSEVRTVCGSAARTGPCGGRSAMTVPTAIRQLAIEKILDYSENCCGIVALIREAPV